MGGAGHPHVARLQAALASLEAQAPRLEAWGQRAAQRLLDGARLLAAGNGGSAAEAQHLTAELVGRYRLERAPLSAVALPADTSSLSAIANDYGYEQSFARQLRAHGRPGDLLVLLSASGASPNVLAAADEGRALGLDVLALTGPLPNPLARRAHEAVAVASPSTAAVQEAHLVAVHMLAEAIDEVACERARTPAVAGRDRGGRA